MSQFPAAHCGMNDNIVMYGRSASSGNESMNCTNNCTHQHIAIDLVNATIVLLKLESGQFARKKELAWGNDEVLTPKGKEQHEEVMKVFTYAISSWKLNKMRITSAAR